MDAATEKVNAIIARLGIEPAEIAQTIVYLDDGTEFVERTPLYTAADGMRIMDEIMKESD